MGNRVCPLSTVLLERSVVLVILHLAFYASNAYRLPMRHPNPKISKNVYPTVSDDTPKVSNNKSQVPEHYTYRYQVSEPDSGVYRDHMEFRNGGIIHGALSVVRDDARIDIKYKGLPWKGWEAFVVRSTPGLPLLEPATPGDSLQERGTVPHRKPLHSYQDLKEMEKRLRLYYHNNHVHVDDRSSNGK